MPRPGQSWWRPSGLALLLPGLFPRTTTARISLLLFIVLFSGSALLLLFLQRTTHSQLDREAQGRITAIARAADTAWRQKGIEAGVTILDGELGIPGPVVIHLAAADGTLLLGNLSTWPEKVPTDRRYYRVQALQSDQGSPEPFMVTAWAMPDGYRLLVGRSLLAEVQLQRSLTAALAAALPLAALLAWLTSRLITGIISDRVRGLADVVGEVTAGKLEARVAVPPGPPADAFDSMGQAFNVMLARVEGLIDELRAVTDGLAHDLRSPLTRLKARIDRLSQSPAVDAAALTAVASEADALLAMLDTSLEITRAEAGIGRESFDDVDLAAMISELAEMYEPLAEETGVAIELAVGGPVRIRAHRQLLGRALANLIDNALRYGAAGKVIALAAEATPAGARLVVADHGPGIPAASRREALRRFGRLDAARGTQNGRGGHRVQGAGLGLSLAAAVARLHGGTITLGDNRPGLKVAIDLPARPALPSAD